MKRFLPLLAPVLLPVLTHGAEAQRTPSTILAPTLGGSPAILLQPSASLLRNGSDRRLEVSVLWESGTESWGLEFGLLMGSSLHDSPYSWSGVTGELGWSGGPVGLGVGAHLQGASGPGPDGSVGLEFTGNRGNVELRVRSGWLRTSPADGPERAVASARGLTWDHHADGELEVGGVVGPVEMGVTGGGRFGGGTSDGPRRWSHLGLRLSPWRSVGVMLGGGVRPDRPEVGQMGGRFLQAGLSVRLGNRPQRPRGKAGEAAPLPPDVQVEPLGLAKYRLTVEAPAARAVELRGDVTGWAAVPLERSGEDGDRWEVLLESPAGTYYVNLRVDGGPWVVPRGLVAIPDRFGGAAGLLELPPPSGTGSQPSARCPVAGPGHPATGHFV